MRAAKQEKNAYNVDPDDESLIMDVASASINASTASSSVEGNMEPVNMAETLISSPSTEIALDLHNKVGFTALFESDAEEETTEELDSQTVFDDCVLTLMRHQHKMLAVLLYCSSKKQAKN